MFESVFRAEFSSVKALARLFGAPKRETEDVAQLVFLALYQAIEAGRFKRGSPPRAWLRAVTYRITRDMVRKLNHQGEPKQIEGGSIEPLDGSLDADIERGVEYRQEWALVLSVLEDLEYERRAVFVLHDLKQLTLAEIATDLGIPVNTVASRLRAAREDFNAALRRRRAVAARKLRGPGALLLLLGADSILRLARTLPRPEAPSDAQARGWARLQQEISVRATTPRERPRRPHKLSVGRPERFISTGLGVVAGVVASALGYALHTAPPLRPTREIAPIIAVADVDYAPAILPILAPAVTDNATASAAPATISAPHAGTDAEGEAERRCLQVARVALDAMPGNPRKALDVLAQCAQRYPAARFTEERARLRQEAEAALRSSRR